MPLPGQTPSTGPTPPATASSRRGAIALASLGVVLLVAIAPLAYLAATLLPVQPVDPTATVIAGSTRPDATAVRTLPVGLAADATVGRVQDLEPYAIAALGLPGATELTDLLSSDREIYPLTANPESSLDFAYPYHYAPFDAILTKAPPDQLRSHAAQLAAALIKLAGEPNAEPTAANTARAAYAVLERTRSTGGCDTALNLLLLVASDPSTSASILTDELGIAEAACPDDPTPAWIVGQTQLRGQIADSDPRPSQTDSPTRGAMAASRRTFEQLAQRFPDDAWVRSGLGDAYLRTGLRLLYSEPFTARDYLKQALRQYNRVAELGDPLSADLGRARAFIGLGEPERAVELANRAVQSRRPGVATEVLLTAQQADHDMPAAEDAARRLERAGVSAYPPAAQFLPVQESWDRGLPFDASVPLSAGADTLAPLQVLLVPRGGAGGSVQDLSFIPQYRDDGPVTATLTLCPALAWRRDVIAAGRAAEALRRWPQVFPASRPNLAAGGGCPGNPAAVLAVGEVAAGQQVAPNRSIDITTDQAFDSWQNLLRWAGDLGAARQAIARWKIEAGEKSSLPLLRLGEVEFLDGHYNEAAASFGDAARLARLADWNDDLRVGQAQLGRAAALVKAGRNGEAVPLLVELQQNSTRGYAYQMSRGNRDTAAEFAALAYHASVQLADHQSATGSLNGAVDNYRAALSFAPELLDKGIRPEAVHNNLALAYLGLGDIEHAQASITKAVDSDPKNPVFLMSAGFVAERAGDTGRAIEDNRAALISDPGAFAAANDLGVQLARTHDYGGAAAALRRAVGAKPDYALGWFNLAVVESRRGPLHLLTSQGAFARAFRLDPSLKDRRRELLIDGSVYRTALDLSKPLPPQWSLAQSQKTAPVASVGLLAAALIALGLVRSSGGGGGDLARQWLEPLSERLNKIRGPQWLRRAAVAMIVTVLAFLMTYFRHASGPTEIVAYAVGVAVIAGLALHARKVVADRRDVVVTQGAWPPGLALGLVTGAIGTPWAPLPVANTDADSNHVHLAAPAALAALSVVLFVEAAWLGVPLTLALAVAAIIMAGSTLLPIKPLDGASLGKTGIIASAGVILGGIFIALGLA